jgi:xanthosine utilization system XapX-like protein
MRVMGRPWVFGLVMGVIVGILVFSIVSTGNSARSPNIVVATMCGLLMGIASALGQVSQQRRLFQVDGVPLTISERIEVVEMLKRGEPSDDHRLRDAAVTFAESRARPPRIVSYWWLALSGLILIIEGHGAIRLVSWIGGGLMLVLTPVAILQARRDRMVAQAFLSRTADADY